MPTCDAALAIFHDHNDRGVGCRWPTRSMPRSPPRAATSTKAAAAVARCSSYYVGLPDSTFVIAGARVLAGQARGAGRRTRTMRALLPSRPPTAFSQIDRPMMLAMCLRHDRRLRRARRRLPALRSTTSMQAVEINDALGLRGFNGVTAGAARLGAAPRRRRGACRGRLQPSARCRPPAEQHADRSFSPSPAWPCCTVSHGRNDRGGRGGDRGARAVPRRRARAGWRTASIRAPTCSRLRRCAAPSSGSWPPTQVHGRTCGTPARAGRTASRRRRRAGAGVPDATASIGRSKLHQPLLGPGGIPDRVRGGTARPSWAHSVLLTTLICQALNRGHVVEFSESAATRQRLPGWWRRPAVGRATPRRTP